MPEIPPSGFKKKVKEISCFSKQKDFWLLIGFGEIYQDFKQQALLREIYLVNIKGNNYYRIEDWNKEKVIKVSIREEKTLNYKIGTIFDCNGNPTRYPQKGDSHLYIKRVVLSNQLNFKREGLIDLISETEFPIFRKDWDYQNKNIPYFYYKGANDKDRVLIPISIISKFFYYSSYSAIHSIIYNRVKSGLVKKVVIDGKHYVSYDDTYINYFDAKRFARYWFTKGEYNGIDLLNNSIQNYYKTLTNNDKTNSKISGEIEYKIPFNFALSVVLLGQYIQKDIFMAYDIIFVSPNQAYNNYFTVEKFELININDKRSSLLKETKEQKGYTKIQGKKSDNNSDELDDFCPTNPTFPKVEKSINNINFFEESPEINILEKEDQEYSYILENLLIKEYDGYGINAETYSGSNKRKANESIVSSISHFKILFEALELIKNKGYQVNYVVINDSNQYPISFAPYCYDSNNKPYKIIDEIIIVTINDDTDQYCIIDGNAGVYIGIFKNLGTPISDANDNKLTSFIRFMLSEHSFAWSEVYFNKNNSELKQENYNRILTNFRYKILQPIEHQSEKRGNITEENVVSNLKKEESLEESLARRILIRILNN
ncbi:MAG: hypothetical protein RBT49_01200 [Bacteroidales bacterium]|jgi:hypothetical protein|nr:hypothetical protein [Bacteroidales bacterium]